MKTKDGRSRLFGFVGYHNQQDAQNAVTKLNNSYIDTSKISLEIAKPVKKIQT